MRHRVQLVRQGVERRLQISGKRTLPRLGRLHKRAIIASHKKTQLVRIWSWKLHILRNVKPSSRCLTIKHGCLSTLMHASIKRFIFRINSSAHSRNAQGPYSTSLHGTGGRLVYQTRQLLRTLSATTTLAGPTQSPNPSNHQNHGRRPRHSQCVHHRSASQELQSELKRPKFAIQSRSKGQALWLLTHLVVQRGPEGSSRCVHEAVCSDMSHSYEVPAPPGGLYSFVALHAPRSASLHRPEPADRRASHKFLTLNHVSTDTQRAIRTKYSA